jgi:putative oxidoreductase
VNANPYTRFTWFLLRVVSGFLFFQAGALGLFGWFGGMPAGAPPLHPFDQMWIGAVLEVVGGLLIVVGLATRPVAFVLSGEMAVAYWQFHAKNGTWPVENGGVPAVLYCFLFLFISAYGAGEWSLDRVLRRRRAAAA